MGKAPTFAFVDCTDVTAPRFWTIVCKQRFLADLGFELAYYIRTAFLRILIVLVALSLAKSLMTDPG